MKYFHSSKGRDQTNTQDYSFDAPISLTHKLSQTVSPFYEILV